MRTKIAITADIHFGDLTKESNLEDLVNTLIEKNVDYLIIAGDLSSQGGGSSSFLKALEILKGFKGEVLFTPGNHDLWTESGSSFELYKNKIPNLLKRSGHRMLDGDPVLINKTGIVGSIGWYDYSFRKVPEDIKESFEDCLFEFLDEKLNVKIIKWDDISLKDYEGKTSKVLWHDKKWKMSTWNDKKYIRWNFTDYDFLHFCIRRLREDIEKIYPLVDEIFVITHHLPFMDFVPDIPDPTWAFHRAYLGSSKIGEVLMEYPKVKYVFSGHVHRQNQKQINGIDAFTTFFKADPGMYLITIEE